MPTVNIGNREVGSSQPCLIIAEAGINHNGNEEIAHRMIDAAYCAGADAIKFQSFRADRLVSESASAPIQVRGFTCRTLLDFFRSMELSADAHGRLKEHADRIGLIFLSTPFDEEMADFLQVLGVPAFKIASADLTHVPLLRHVARKGKPVLLSTGMSFLEEVRVAIDCLRGSGASEIALLHCVTSYPAPSQELNLRSIVTLRTAFGLPVGFSDHATDPLFAQAAVALGASILERHFTLDRSMPGPDQSLSMDPLELQQTVHHIRLLETAFGNGVKQPSPCEMENRRLSRRSLVLRSDHAAGQRLEAGALDARRPASGIPPTEIDRLVGRRLLHPVRAGKALEWSDLAAD